MLPSPVSSDPVKMAFWALKATEYFISWIEALPKGYKLDHGKYLQRLLEKIMKEKVTDIRTPYMANLLDTICTKIYEQAPRNRCDPFSVRHRKRNTKRPAFTYLNNETSPTPQSPT